MRGIRWRDDDSPLGGSRIATELDHNVTKFHFVFFQSRFYSRFTMDWLRVGSDEKLGSFCHVIMFLKCFSSHPDTRAKWVVGSRLPRLHSIHSYKCSFFPQNFSKESSSLFSLFLLSRFQELFLHFQLNFPFPLNVRETLAHIR